VVDIFVWFGFIVAGVVGFIYLRLNSKKWNSARQSRMAVLVFGSQIALMLLWLLYGAIAADRELKAAKEKSAAAYRDIWKGAQQLPLGYPLTNQSLKELKEGLERDPQGLAAALGDADLQALKERIQKNDAVVAEKEALASKIDDQKKQIAELRLETDKKLADARQLSAVTDRYGDELRKAEAAVKEHKRLAPAGEFTLTVEYTLKKDAAADQIELALLVSLIQMQCLSDANLNVSGDTYTRHFDHVTQEYADRMSARLRAAGATVTITKTPAANTGAEK
jgi:hypothetical protein